MWNRKLIVKLNLTLPRAELLKLLKIHFGIFLTKWRKSWFLNKMISEFSLTKCEKKFGVFLRKWKTIDSWISLSKLKRKLNLVCSIQSTRRTSRNRVNIMNLNLILCFYPSSFQYLWYWIFNQKNLYIIVFCCCMNV